MLNKFQITPRRWWYADPPKFEQKLIQPAPLVFFTHTGTDVSFSFNVVIQELRRIQQKQMNRGAVDITYNFIIGPNGQVFEGRGWHFAAKTPMKFQRFSRNSINIAYMGDFRFRIPEGLMLRAGQNIIKLGLQKRFISKKFLEFHINMCSVPISDPSNEVLSNLT